jgi:Arc/MetJ family transcription regulator
LRITLVIDDRLMAEALKSTNLTSTREVVELAPHTLLRLRHQQAIRRLRGKLTWGGDLEASRSDA